jgi:hypothetical protein
MLHLHRPSCDRGASPSKIPAASATSPVGQARRRAIRLAGSPDPCVGPKTRIRDCPSRVVSCRVSARMTRCCPPGAEVVATVGATAGAQPGSTGGPSSAVHTSTLPAGAGEYRPAFAARPARMSDPWSLDRRLVSRTTIVSASAPPRPVLQRRTSGVPTRQDAI